MNAIASYHSARIGRAKISVLGLHAGLCIILGSGQLCIERQEISRPLLNPLWLHAAYTGSPLVQTVGLHACPFHTCVNDSRDMCCATASTIRQYMERSSARILRNPFVQCLLQRHVLVFFGELRIVLWPFLHILGPIPPVRVIFFSSCLGHF